MNSSFSSRAFSSLYHNKDFRFLFAGLSMSQIGTNVQDIAQSWVVLEYTNSPQSVSIVIACLFTPYAVLGLIIGPFLERLDSKKTMIVCQILSSLSAFTLSLLYFIHQLTPLWIYVLAFMRGIILILNKPMRQILIRQCNEKEHIPNAIALHTTLSNLARIVGPALGGVLLALLNAGFCFLINGLSYFVIIFFLVRIRLTKQSLATSPLKRKLLIKELRSGLNYVRKQPYLADAFIILTFIAIFCLNFHVLLPILAQFKIQANPLGFGLVTALFGGGAMMGALFTAYFNKHSFSSMVFTALVLGVSFVGVALISNIWILSILIAAQGIFYSLYTTMTNAYIQLAIDDKFQGRILALYAYIVTGTTPLGAFIISFLTNGEDITYALLIPGLVAILAALYGYLKMVRKV